MEFHISVEIDAAQETVWSVMADVERWHEWTPSIRSIRLFGSGRLAVGRRALVRQPKFPPAFWTVVALDPGTSFVWKSGAPGLWVYGHHSVIPSERGSKATLRLHYEGPLGALFARWTSGITRRYLAYEAEGLKRRSESITQSTPLGAQIR
jgi:hypothetical protein